MQIATPQYGGVSWLMLVHWQVPVLPPVPDEVLAPVPDVTVLDVLVLPPVPHWHESKPVPVALQSWMPVTPPRQAQDCWVPGVQPWVPELVEPLLPVLPQATMPTARAKSAPHFMLDL
jgi:hypothetical protein